MWDKKAKLTQAELDDIVGAMPRLSKCVAEMGSYLGEQILKTESQEYYNAYVRAIYDSLTGEEEA